MSHYIRISDLDTALWRLQNFLEFLSISIGSTNHLLAFRGSIVLPGGNILYYHKALSMSRPRMNSHFAELLY